jgi:pimeloyl-ACP methyl ester carboxylesterase
MKRTDSAGLGPTSHVFFSQRLRLHYVDYGQPDGPLLVLVHGGRDHARSWDFVAAELRNRYHVVAPDLRGHGDSAWAVGSQYAMPDYLLDLSQLLRHLGTRPVALIGHSLGGAIALQYAGTYPERVARVAAIEGLGPPPAMLVDKPIEERLDEWIQTMELLATRQPRRYASIREAAERMREANPRLSPEIASHLTVRHYLARRCLISRPFAVNCGTIRRIWLSRLTRGCGGESWRCDCGSEGNGCRWILRSTRSRRPGRSRA